MLGYFQKVLTTRKPIFYVDCFSGKGKFDDGQPGSPIIALSIRNQCLDRTKMNIDKRTAIKTTFIDLNYANDLEQNLQGYNGNYGTVHIIKGKYEEKILDLLRDKRGQNVFLYIDPYGIKALDMALFDQFETFGFNTFEMLINFNSFGFFRDACRVMSVEYNQDEAFQNLEELVEYLPTDVSEYESASDILTKIAGGDYWKQVVQQYKNKEINGYQAEQIFSTEYKKRLKKRYKYVLDMPIRLREGQRPKYRMIHVSDHEDGCFLMAQNMQNRKTELYTNIQNDGQITLFDIISDFSKSVEGDLMTKEEVELKVQECLNSLETDINITKFLATFFNTYGLICEFKMVYDILRKMEDINFIEVLRKPDKTKSGKKSTFWEEKAGTSVIIRRLNE